MKQPDFDVYQIEAFFGDGVSANPHIDHQELFGPADVILGRDVNSQHLFPLFGLEIVRRIAESDVAEVVNGFIIELDQETDELEKAVALVKVMKGRHDYPSSGDE